MGSGIPSHSVGKKTKDFAKPRSFQLYLVYRTGGMILGEIYDDQGEAEKNAERILSLDGNLIEIHVGNVVASYAKQSRAVKVR